MNKPLLHVLLSLLMCLTLPLAATAQVVDIPDPNLRTKIEETLGKAAGATITTSDMERLTRLEARNANISDLTGLEHATNLTELDLGGEWVDGEGFQSNSISDLVPLSGLMELTRLELRGNNISDISPVAGLTNLKRLSFEENKVSDISPVAGLINLTELRLFGNDISDISPLSGLTNLTWLQLFINNITDLSPLSGLTNLTRLSLASNDITDISPLSGLANLTILGLANNSISDISPLAGLTNLERLGLRHNFISDISALAGLTQLARVDLRHNYISDLSPFVANTGLGTGDEVVLNDNRLSAVSIKTHVPALQSKGVTVEFDDTTHLNTGEPRTVRMIYFLPNDRPYRADVVQRMKDDIQLSQTFFAEQMEAHGYGRLTFRFESDLQGEPMVHRVNGQHANSHYLADFDDPSTLYWDAVVLTEVGELFNFFTNIYLVLIDSGRGGGYGESQGKGGGKVLVDDASDSAHVTHELGHAFGLHHDFRDGAYIMSYGPGPSERLSACHAEYLSVHPYFNPDIPIEQGPPPSIELISPLTYPAESKRVPVRFRISDSDGLHQWLLHAWQPHVKNSVKVCRGVRGTQEIIINFDYDGVIPSAHDPFYSRNTSLLNPLVHPIRIEAVDVNGNVGKIGFPLFSEAFQPLSKISGDNQRGVPNTPLAIPFVVELRDMNNGWGEPGVPVTFTVTAGGGTLNVTHTTTDIATLKMGRAESTLTLGPNLGTNTVEVSAGGFTVTFNAVAGAPVDIPDANLRAAIEKARGKAPGTPIAPSDMAKLTKLEAANSNISDLTGLEFATNLKSLWLGYGGGETSHAVQDLSPLADLTQLTSLHLPGKSISDISAVAGLTNLTWLNLEGNPISDSSPVVGLTKLTGLYLGNNNISDISPLVANTGLGSGDTVYVRENPLSYQSLHIHIPTLQSRGVTVEFDADGTRPPDVNDDGSVNVLDLIAVTSYFGNTGTDIAADVSGDDVVDVLDLVLVAGMLQATAAAPSPQAQAPETLTAVEVRGWLTEARALEVRDPIMKRGLMVLEQLLVSLTPKETELLANFPNPFNPETWIPYRLAEDAFVTLTIYDLSGQVVRTLEGGHRIASAYEGRSKAIHWDGRNDVGEPVASGVYFYTLTAGDYSATRRMVILK